MQSRLIDIAKINPPEYIRKDGIAKKISMDMLIPFTRDVPSSEYASYNGGSKFRNGDIIMARITPCLENGKVSQINCLDEDEVAFGSTEFIVFRARENVADPNFLYYLICSPFIRENAIKSMIGTSGRQRVQIDAVANLVLEIPELDEQIKIGNILSKLDDKISVNRKINDNLAA